MEERCILRQQRVHADHVEVLDAATVEAVQAVDADPPQDLGEKKDACEAEHIRHRRTDADGPVADQAADQLSDDQRRDVVDARVSQRGSNIAGTVKRRSRGIWRPS